MSLIPPSDDPRSCCSLSSWADSRISPPHVFPSLLASSQLSLPEVLTYLESASPPSLELPSIPTALAVCHSNQVLVGLYSGEILLVSFFPTSVQYLFESNSQHSEEVLHLVVTSDSQRAISAGKDLLLKVWGMDSMRELATLQGHEGEITCLELTPSNDKCVSGSKDASVKVWSLVTFTLVATLAGHCEEITCIALTPSGDYLISGSEDTLLKLWSLETGTEAATWEGHRNGIQCVAVTSDGAYCVSAAWDTMKVWHIPTSNELYTVDDTPGISCLGLTHDCRYVVLCTEDSMKLYDLKEFREVGEFCGYTDSDTYGITIFPPDSDYCVTKSDKSVSLFSMKEMCQLAAFAENTEDSGYRLMCAAVTRDRKWVVTGDSEHSLKMWSVVSRDKVETFYAEEEKTQGVTRDGRYLVRRDGDLHVRIRDFQSNTELSVCCSYSSKILGIFVSQNSPHILSWSFTDVKLKSLDTLDDIASCSCIGGQIVSFCLTPDSKKCLIATENTIELWLISTVPSIVTTLIAFDRTIDLSVLAPNGDFLIISLDNTIKLWNIATKEKAAAFTSHTSRITCIAVTPNSALFLTGAADNTIKLWSIAELRETHTFAGHLDDIHALVVTPDGSRAVSASKDAQIKVWSLSEMCEIHTFSCNSGPIAGLNLTSDGNYCLSASKNEVITVWSLTDFREVATLTEKIGYVRGLAVTPDNSKCVWWDVIGSIVVQPLSVPIVSNNAREPPLPTPFELISNIRYFREGIARSVISACDTFPSHTFNSLHISAYFNHSDRLRDYLAEGVPAIRGAFGSPLTVAIDRKATKCIDSVLLFLIETIISAGSDHCWVKFVPYNEDIPLLLRSSSTLTIPFFRVLMQPPACPSLPQFISPLEKIPMIRHIDSRFVRINEFDGSGGEQVGRQLVRFLISFPRCNLTPGSANSLKILTALCNCWNKQVLATPFISYLITEKWNGFFPFTLGMTTMYTVLLVNLVLIVFRYWEMYWLCIGFLSLNGLFLLYEAVQLVATGWFYWTDSWNIVDIARGTMCVVWATQILRAGETPDTHLTLLILLLCFFRGFTYFRSFRMTRIFVYMTIAVVREVYSFLLILAYSVFAFGIMTSTLLSNHSAADALTSSFNLIMGTFDNSAYGGVEWGVFIAASVTNVIIMLNLLISILGEAYDKTQMSVRENDLNQMLYLVTEYEYMMFWRRNQGLGRVMVICESAESGGQSHDWTGRIREITNIITKDVRQVECKVDKFEQRFTGIEKNLEDIKKLVSELNRGKRSRKYNKFEDLLEAIQGKIGEMEGNLGEKFRLLEGKMAIIEGKVDSLSEVKGKTTISVEKRGPRSTIKRH